MATRSATHPLDPYAPTDGRLLTPFDSAIAFDWSRWQRNLERRRRERPETPPSLERLSRVAANSFRLEGIAVSDADALAATRPSRSMCSPARRRIRNHLAIQRTIAARIARGRPLRTTDLLRWYTLLCNGLNASMPAGPKLERIDSFVRRANSPPMRLSLAVREAVSLHVQALADALVPSFAGLIARLVLEFQLGRSGLPPICFESRVDAPLLLNESMLLRRVTTLIEVAVVEGQGRE